MKKEKSVRKAEFQAALFRQLKSLIVPFIILAIILIGVLVISFSQGEAEPEEVVRVNGYEGEETEITLENDKLLFSMNSLTTQFSVTMKETGETWTSNPEGAAEDSAALEIEKNKLQSTVLLTYSTQNGVDALLDNYEYSIAKGIYEIETGDGYIKVNYSIGDLEQEYVVPLVMEEDRMEEYLSKMGQRESLMIGEYYKKLDINDLSKSDKAAKDELTARYPSMETTVIYVLRDNVKASIQTKLQQYFEEAGYTYEEYVEDKEKDKQEKVSEKSVFNVSVIYRLDGDDLIVEVPFDDLEYKEDYPIYYLSVLPYFGASGTTDEGFLFVPEGGGALIEFNNGKTSQNSYYSNVYGWDMGQDRDAVVHDTRTYFNVFGESNDSSFICMLEDGVPYASIQADISGRSHSYNYVNAVYSVLHREQYDVSDRSTQSMFVYEDGTAEGEGIVQRYSFIDSGDYVDMAEDYRSYLKDKYGDYLTVNDDTETPVALEIIGAVDKVKQVFGVPVSSPLELTTYKEAQEMVEELYGEGLSNMSVKLSGWMNGGVQQKMLDSVNLISDLGSKKDLQNMIDSAEEKGIAVYLNGITNYAMDSGITDGFFVYTDAAKFVSQESAKLNVYDTVTYEKAEEDRDPFYLLKADLVYEMMDNLADAANGYHAGVSFSDIGYELSSDFYQKDPTSRQMAMEEQAEKLKSLDDNGTDIMINMGNDYAVAYADMVTNMDLEGTEYSIIDKKIPFYQLAIHGYVNYTGEALNLTQNTQNELLNSAEYGAGLAFTFMKESAFELQNTLYTEYFGADYSAWHDEMLEIYTRYNEELGHTFNQKMVGHEYVTSELTCTIYEDGTKVYVNYSYDELQADDGTVVPARDYVVVR